ncbi:hypothetical protein NHQ30_005954 [Ciborinia camelliae]|nr:hypothetical protein NHQ30_005954 [Ciborinia camelliae]
MSTNDTDPLRPPSSQAQDYPIRLSTSPRNISTSLQNPQYLSNSPQETRYSNSPQETRYSTSPLDPRHLSHDQRLSASPTAAELYIHGEPFPELPEYPAHVVDPLIHIQQPSTEHDELSQMPSSPPTSFAPFFTLITDSTVLINDKDGNSQTPTTHHPNRIHYIFSDDEDGEVLKNACLRCIPDVPNPSNSSHSFTNKSSGELRASHSSSRPPLLRKCSSKDGNGKGKQKEREERVILIDMNGTGDRVVKAQSLSGKWQVMGCEIGKAPIWESAGEEGKENKEKGGALMLRIDGVGIPSVEEDLSLSLSGSGSGGREKSKGKGIDGGGGGEDIEEESDMDMDMDKLLEGFDRKMSVLRKVIGGVGWDQGQGLGQGHGQGSVHHGHGVNNIDGEGDANATINIPGPELGVGVGVRVGVEYMRIEREEEGDGDGELFDDAKS